MTISKQAVRQKYFDSVKQISKEERRKKEKIICQKLFKLDVWKKAKTIALTLPTVNEVSLALVFEQARLEHKKIVVPITLPQYQMVFVEYKKETPLQKTQFGVFEPILEQAVICPKEQLDLIIVPGVSYSKDGQRIGFGGGYYDRFLADFKKNKVSLAYDFQIYDEAIWQSEATDITLDMIISEKEVYIS